MPFFIFATTGKSTGFAIHVSLILDVFTTSAIELSHLMWHPTFPLAGSSGGICPANRGQRALFAPRLLFFSGTRFCEEIRFRPGRFLGRGLKFSKSIQYCSGGVVHIFSGANEAWVVKMHGAKRCERKRFIGQE